jgi:hypothetical protein
MHKLLSLIYQYSFSFFYRFRVFQFNPQSKNKVVRLHIFGSGSSVNQTKSLVTKRDRTFCCNHAAQYLKSWDYIFVENLSDDEYGTKQMKILQDVKYKKLIFKNLYFYSNRFSFRNFKKLRGLKFCILLDYQCKAHNVLGAVKSFDTSGLIVPQYASSILTMLLVGLKEGHSEILLHGVDFSISNSQLHQTEMLKIPFSQVLEEIVRYFDKIGIKVYFAKEFLA